MRIVVGMSGGVDSSVAALLLKQAGHAVSGLFMFNWEDADPESGCRADVDRKDALTVCAQLGIPFRDVSFAAEYRARVFARFLAGYRAGRTPNPDVLCNPEIKFGSFLDAAHAAGAERIATGHYARLEAGSNGWNLLRARDHAKDQSYFLHRLDQQQLGAALFPLGELEKTEVRRIAAAAGLPVAAKRDSTGICFIGERDFRTFLADYLPAHPGELRTPGGRVVGEHPGACYFTLGQRSGLNIGGQHGGNGHAWYVVAKDIARNIVYVDQNHDSPWLVSHALAAGDVHWIAGSPVAPAFACMAMTRYRQPPQRCHVEIAPDRVRVRFEDPQRAVAPGQSVVFYAGEACLGGAVIETTDAPAVVAP